MRKSKEEVKIFKRSRRIDHIEKKMDPIVKKRGRERYNRRVQNSKRVEVRIGHDITKSKKKVYRSPIAESKLKRSRYSLKGKKYRRLKVPRDTE